MISGQEAVWGNEENAPKAAYYNKQKLLPGNVRFLSFDIVLRLNGELGGV